MALNSVMMKFAGDIFSATSASVIILNASEEIIWINDAFRKFSGYCLADLKENSRRSFIPVQHEEKYKSMIRLALLGASQDALDIPIICSDNRIENIRWTAILIDDKASGEKAVVLFGVKADKPERNKSDLEIAEERYKLLFENTGIGMMFISEDTIIAIINKEFEKLTGYAKDEVEGKMSWTDLIACEDDLNRMRNFHRLRRIDANSAPDLYDTVIKTRGGDIRKIMIRVTMIPGTAYSLISLIDMTERMLAEEALRESEEKYRSLVDNMQDTLYRCDREGDITFVSPSGVQLLGFDSVEELIGKNIAETFYYKPEMRTLFINELNKSGKVTNYEIILKRKDGSPCIVSTNSQFIYDKHGKIIGVEGIFSDITQRKQAEEMSRQSEEKFTKIFMMTPDCVAITRIKDGLIIDVNKGFEEITGWKRNEAVGLTCYDIGFWGETAERNYMVDELNAGRDILHHEFQFRRIEGSLRTGVYSVRPINIGGEDCLIFVLQDITDWKHLTEDRLKLEHQLFQSQKMDAIGQLASGVAHDFNNILMGIQANASLMMMEHDPEHPHHQRLKRMEDHIKRGANLTGQLLGFAREGKYEVKTVSINNLILQSAQFFLETRKEIEVDFKLQDDLYPIEADPGQIEQVLLNIYINAGHAMPKGGHLDIQTVNVNLQEAEAKDLNTMPGDYVKISISDTGTGMDAKTLERIFEPFFTTKSQQGGTGLGLASAYGIIRNHEGCINACSRPGQGSTFNIYLPSSVKKVEMEKKTAENRVVLSGNGGILLVDDESLILDTASDLLKRLGYTVYKAATGQEAVSIYCENQNRIDLVILDMILPGMSGSHVFGILRDINPDVKVILSSGYGLQGEVRNVMEMGCQGFIQKPYSVSDLSNIVHHILFSDSILRRDANFLD